MKTFVILCIAAVFLSQVYGQEMPATLYRMYNDDITDTMTPANELTGIANYTYDSTVRYAGDTTNKALNTASDAAGIIIPTANIPSVSGDFTVAIWAQLNADQDHNGTSQNFIGLFRLEKGGGTLAFQLNIQLTDGLVSIYTNTGNDLNSAPALGTTWNHYAVSYNSGTTQLQVYVNGVAHGSPLTYAVDFTEVNQIAIASSNGVSYRAKGGFAEFAIYNTQWHNDYHTAEYGPDFKYVPSLNKLVPVADPCPASTTQWNIGSDPANRVCIHDTCSERFADLISYLKTNLTITTNTTGLSWEDNVNIDFSITKNDCGADNNETCFIDECFSHGILQAEDSDFNLTAVPADMGEFYFPSETGFGYTDYHNDTTNCDITADSSTCYFILPFFFHGTTSTTTFSRDMAFIDYKFTIAYNKVPGEDTLTAELTNQGFGTVSHEEVVDVEADIIKAAEALAGATLVFQTPPASIEVGDELTLILSAPDGHNNRDFKNNTLDVEFAFTSNGTEVVIPVTPTNVQYLNDGVADSFNRTLLFTVAANYLGTYTIRAGATLEAHGARLLLEGEELNNLNSQLQITVVQPQQTSANFVVVFVSIALIALVAQNFILRRNKANQSNRYEQVQLDTQV